jgi:hypothetical protein
MVISLVCLIIIFSVVFALVIPVYMVLELSDIDWDDMGRALVIWLISLSILTTFTLHKDYLLDKVPRTIFNSETETK